MTLSVRGVFGDGLAGIRSVNGTLFIGIMFILTAATEAVLGGLRLRTTLPGPLEEFLAVSPVTLSVSAPSWMLWTGLVVLFALTLSATIVFIRLLLAETTDTVPVSVVDGLVPAAVRLAGAGFVVLVLTTVGSVFLVLPGLLILVSLMFYAVFIARGEGIVASLKGSWGLARGTRIRLFAVFVVLVVLNVGLEAVAYLVPSATVGVLVEAIGTVYALAVMVAAYSQLGGDTA